MKLEEYRVKKGMSYTKLAKHLGLKRGTVYNICNESISCISLQNAHIIFTKTHGIVGYEELLWGDC